MTDKRRKPTGATPAQIAANQRNAQKSTGPRTEAGKSRSSQNATKHGAHARTPHAIVDGPFAEDPEQIEELLDALMAALSPRDILEEARAVTIAQLQLRELRLDNYEAALLQVGSLATQLREAERVDRLEEAIHGWVCDWNLARWPDRADLSGSPFDAGSDDTHRASPR